MLELEATLSRDWYKSDHRELVVDIELVRQLVTEALLHGDKNMVELSRRLSKQLW